MGSASGPSRACGRAASSPRWSFRSPGCTQLCAPMLDSLERLPDPQRDALRVAFGLQDGQNAGSLPGRACGAQSAGRGGRGATAALRSSTTRSGSTARPRRRSRSSRAGCSPSRSRWCSSCASPAGERARRAARSSSSTGIAEATRARCWPPRSPGRWTSASGRRIVAETRGNPLALLELPRGLTPAELAGGFGARQSAAAGGPHRAGLPPAVRVAPARSAAAAADGGGRAGRRRRVAVARGRATRDRSRRGRAGRGRRAGRRSARGCGSAIHSCARRSIARQRRPNRREVHRALAEATDPEADPDRRAWHRAHAAAGLDEAVADELERSADRARRRGGVAAAAAFLERAAELTPDPARRGARALAAAQAKLEAGSREAAEELLATAELAPLDELQRALLQRLRAQIAFVFTRGSDGPPLLLDAARRLEALDPGVGARDIPRGARSGDVRRTRRRRLGCRGGCRGGPRRARGARSRRDRSTSFSTGWPAGARTGPARAYRRCGSRSQAVMPRGCSTATKRSCAGSCCLRSSSR